MCNFMENEMTNQGSRERIDELEVELFNVVSSITSTTKERRGILKKIFGKKSKLVSPLKTRLYDNWMKVKRDVINGTGYKTMAIDALKADPVYRELLYTVSSRPELGEIEVENFDNREYLEIACEHPSLRSEALREMCKEDYSDLVQDYGALKRIESRKMKEEEYLTHLKNIQEKKKSEHDGWLELVLKRNWEREGQTLWGKAFSFSPQRDRVYANCIKVREDDAKGLGYSGFSEEAIKNDFVYQNTTNPKDRKNLEERKLNEKQYLESLNWAVKDEVCRKLGWRFLHCSDDFCNFGKHFVIGGKEYVKAEIELQKKYYRMDYAKYQRLRGLN